MIDLRSDTVTKPTQAMLQAMLAAQVGDDVYGEDPTVNQLENQLAKQFGKQAGLFCASGTQTNQIAIIAHTQPAQEVICADNAHVFKYEGGGMAANAHVQPRVLTTLHGKITAKQVALAINNPDVHFAETALVCIENTVNRAGGCFYTKAELEAIFEVCQKHNLPMHLDGARIFNALLEADYDAKFCGQMFNSISVCLSKGLGAPVGSVLLGSAEFIAKARRIRKRLGGGMRQAGYLAAAGLFALEHHVSLLKQDHTHAQQVAEVLQSKPWVNGMLPVLTNIIIFNCNSAQVALALKQYLHQNGILANAVSDTELRFVFHLDISTQHIQQIISTIHTFNPF